MREYLVEEELEHYRDGLIPGRRLPGTIRPVRFLWSEVEAAWNGLADEAAREAREAWTGRLPRRVA